ncbi:MAG TPA: tautomerase family protein [Spirochaetia bacterium]|nr:MAG: 4-oxalocrotonate tautomerase [Spirochaetes bacterium GWB1_36_13]HCL57715.1 tautomerase family protein [Spirochaetia bacterium]
MPLVKIEILKGKTAAYKKALLDSIHSALVQVLKIPENDRIQRLYELESSHFEFSSPKTSQLTLLEITLFPGRKRETKKNLYESIVQNLGKNPGIQPDDIFIILLEPPLENWGIRGGKPADEIQFSYKIDL